MGFLFGNDNPLHEQQVMGGVDPAVIQAVMGLINQQPMQQPDPQGASKFYNSFTENKFDSAISSNQRRGDTAMNAAVGMKGPKMPDYPLRPGEAGIGIIGALLAKAFGAKDRDINDFAQGFLGSRGQAQTNQYNAAVQEHQRVANLKKLEADQAYRNADNYRREKERFSTGQERKELASITARAKFEAQREDDARGMVAKLPMLISSSPESVQAQINEIRRMGVNIDPVSEQAYLAQAGDVIKAKKHDKLLTGYNNAKQRSARLNAAWELKTFAEANGIPVQPDILEQAEAYTVDEQYKMRLGDKLNKEIEFFAEKEQLNDANILKIKAEAAAIPVRARASYLSAEASMKNANRAIRTNAEKLIANPKAPNFASQVSSMNAVINPAVTNLKQMRAMITTMSGDKKLNLLGPEGEAQMQALIKAVETKESEIKVWEAAREELKTQWLANINAGKAGQSSQTKTSGGTRALTDQELAMADSRYTPGTGNDTATKKLNRDYEAFLKSAGNNATLRNKAHETYRALLAHLNKK